MTPEKTKEAFDAIAALTRVYAPEVREAKRIDPAIARANGLERCAHLLFMCEEGKRLVDAGRIEKAMRWLGFDQGVVWCESMASIAQMKDLNRPDDRNQ